VRQGARVLLGMKKKGLGTGRWNGFGGKVEEGEEIEEAAKRELYEESGLQAERLKKVGTSEFYSPVRPFVVEMHIFEARDVTGEPQESNEMHPQWFDIGDLPREDMWPSDLLWWPLYLAGKKLTARFVFDAYDNVLEHDIAEA
jgi:8-oxo-dGTP diphosphatase / 2-hydroxy-dATP diphosphatase